MALGMKHSRAGKRSRRATGGVGEATEATATSGAPSAGEDLATAFPQAPKMKAIL